MASEEWQSLRNKIYAIIGLVATVLVTIGTVDQATADEGVNILSLTLNLIGEGISLFGIVLAWWKTRLKANTTLDIPSANVIRVLEKTEMGNVVTAGPGSPIATGTILTDEDI